MTHLVCATVYRNQQVARGIENALNNFMNANTCTWTKVEGKWMARGPLFLFSNRYVQVASKDGRITLCRITGTVPAVGEDTDTNWNRIVTVAVERETRSIRERMQEVPLGAC